MSEPRPFVSVVVAAYDEAGNVGELVTRLQETLRDLPATRWELVFVVSGDDGTREILEERATALPALRVLHEGAPAGLGVAMERGFAAVSPDATAVVTLDADLNHQPEEVPRLLAALDSADIVVGSRLLPGSRVAGLPVWKSLLSRTINSLLGWLSGQRVRDKTSGFRAYRAAALRGLAIRHPGFAFLPDLLLQAHASGLAVVEVPIRFTQRRHGRSKMAFWRTSRSYLTLLGQGELGAGLLASALVALGLAVRLAATFPVHKGVGHADNMLTGMQALRIGEGEWPVFFSGVRIGALESYVAAALFSVAGAGRAALAVEPLLWAAVLLAAGWGLYRELLGGRGGAVALLLLAVPAPSFLVWSSMTNGYPPVYALGAVALWLAARAARLGLSARRALALGAAVGLGCWQSPLTLSASVPAALWLLWRRPELRRLRRAHLAGLAGLLLGAAPWLLGLATGAAAQLYASYATRPVESPAAAVSNLAYFATYSLPEIVAARSESFVGLLPDHAGQAHRALRPVVLGLWLAALLAILLPARNAPEPWRRRIGDARVLLLMVLGTVAVLNAISSAGSGRGITVRYVLPLYLVLPLAMAVLVWRVKARSTLAAAGLLAVLVAYHASGYHWPGRASRALWGQAEARERELTRELRRRGIGAVVGGYWTAYPINFISRHRVVAVPCSEDYYGYRTRVPQRTVRWAMVSARPEPLLEWASAAGVSGTLEPAGGAYLILPHEAAGPVPLARLLSSCNLHD